MGWPGLTFRSPLLSDHCASGWLFGSRTTVDRPQIWPRKPLLLLPLKKPSLRLML